MEKEKRILPFNLYDLCYNKDREVCLIIGVFDRIISGYVCPDCQKDIYFLWNLSHLYGENVKEDEIFPIPIMDSPGIIKIEFCGYYDSSGETEQHDSLSVLNELGLTFLSYDIGYLIYDENWKIINDELLPYHFQFDYIHEAQQYNRALGCELEILPQLNPNKELIAEFLIKVINKVGEN